MASIKETVSKVANRKPKLIKGRATSVEVRKADDGSGYIARTHFDDKGEYAPAHESVHKTLSSVHKHCKDCFEGGEGAGPKDDDGDETDEM